MPIYEYRCSKCGSVFDVLQKFSDAPLTVHENCGGAVERLLSPPALQFKGSGWYITDYAKGSRGGSKSDAKSESNSESKKTESKSDSKSSETSPAKTESKPSSNSKPSE